MPTLYVARSRSLQGWAAEVGLTLNVYKLGLSAAPGGAAAIDALNAASFAGRSDWELMAEQPADADTDTDAEIAMIERAKRKETEIDPTYYPQIRRARGIFKVKPANAENHFLVREALDGQQQIKAVKLTPARIATYLLRTAAG
ncbi:MAG: hypothetical protein IPK66_09225 [Rhodospirillales bacterium]|nr:hypothetical protein [Rhodospirillales bacterium]